MSAGRYRDYELSNALDVEKSVVNLVMGSKKPRKRSGSDPPLPTVRLPPWYVRIFLYTMMAFCFIMVLFWSPNRQTPAVFSAAFEEGNQPAQEELNEDHPVNLINWDTFAPTAGPTEPRCEEMTELKPSFALCHDLPAKPVPNLKVADAIRSVLVSEPDDVAFVDINPGLGVYSLIALKLGRRVIAMEAMPSNIVLLQHSAKRLEALDRLKMAQNALSDSHGHTSLEDRERRRDVAVESVPVHDLVRIIEPRNLVLRVVLRDYECLGMVHSKELFARKNVIQVVTEVDPKGNVNPACFEKLYAAFERQGLRPYNNEGRLLQLKDASKYGWGPEPIVWKRD